MATPARLAEDVRAALASADNDVLVSAATAWEIAIKHALGRLEFPVQNFDGVLARMGFEPLPIQPRHAVAASALPPHHQDPFDRMLVAQAQTERLTLVSDDGAVKRYDVPLLRAST